MVSDADSDQFIPLLTNAANLEAGTGECTQGALCSWAGGLGLVAAGGAQLDVQGADTKLLQHEISHRASNAEN